MYDTMFVRRLAAHCDQNKSNKIAMNDYKARELNKMGNLIFVFQLSAMGNLPLR